MPWQWDENENLGNIVVKFIKWQLWIKVGHQKEVPLQLLFVKSNKIWYKKGPKLTVRLLKVGYDITE